MEKVELLVSTMFAQKDLLEKLNVQSDAVIINQCDVEGKEVFFFNGHRILWIDTKTCGLSISRNLALRNATADYVVLSDDDMQYEADYPGLVQEHFAKHPDADILAFQLWGVDRVFKQYDSQEKKIGFIGAMHLCSAELAFRRTRIMDNGLHFEECFGSGAKYKMGEENIFLFQCIKKGLRIRYCPKLIASLWVGNSTWFTGFGQKYFFDRGATYQEMFGVLAPIMVAQFILRKRKRLTEISMREAWKQAREGMRERKNEKRQGALCG